MSSPCILVGSAEGRPGKLSRADGATWVEEMAESSVAVG